MTNEQAIAELQKEHDLIQGEHELDGSQFAPELLEALAMAIEAMREVWTEALKERGVEV